MLRVKTPFIIEVDIPTSSNDENSQNFSLYAFRKELEKACSIDHLFFNLPVKIEISEQARGDQTWVTFSFTIDAMEDEVYCKLLKHCVVDVLPKETFHIAFNVLDNKDGKHIIGFSTNLRSDIFRELMFAIPNFTKFFFPVLKQSDYYIYDENIVAEVKQSYQRLIETYLEESKHACYRAAIFTTPNATHLDLYFRNATEQEMRMEFAQLAYAYQTSKYIRPQNVLYVDPKTSRFYASKNIKGPLIGPLRPVYMLPSNTIKFDQFIEPTTPECREYVSEHIIRQLQIVQSLKRLNPRQQLFALYIGAGYGDNVTKIQNAYPNLNCFAVEPSYGRVSKYQADKKKLFFSYLEDLVNIPELHQLFDYVFILNYNVISNHNEFFNSVLWLMKPNANLIVGQNISDPYFFGTPVSFLEYMKKYFVNTQFVKIHTLESSVGYQMHPIVPDYLPSVEIQKNIVKNMAKILSDNKAAGGDSSEIEKSLIYYATNFKQFLYSAEKSEVEADKKHEFEQAQISNLQKPFYQHILNLSAKAYEERLNLHDPYEERVNINQNTLNQIRLLKEEFSKKVNEEVCQNDTPFPTIAPAFAVNSTSEIIADTNAQSLENYVLNSFLPYEGAIRKRNTNIKDNSKDVTQPLNNITTDRSLNCFRRFKQNCVIT